MTTRGKEKMESEQLPERPGMKNCRYYMKNGTCGFGMKCIFNHPPKRMLLTMRGTGLNHMSTSGQELGSEQLLQSPGIPYCPLYMKMGTCRFGSSCMYYHPPNWMLQASLGGKETMDSRPYLETNDKEKQQKLFTVLSLTKAVMHKYLEEIQEVLFDEEQPGLQVSFVEEQPAFQVSFDEEQTPLLIQTLEESFAQSSITEDRLVQLLILKAKTIRERSDEIKSLFTVWKKWQKWEEATLHDGDETANVVENMGIGSLESVLSRVRKEVERLQEEAKDVGPRMCHALRKLWAVLSVIVEKLDECLQEVKKFSLDEDMHGKLHLHVQGSDPFQRHHESEKINLIFYDDSSNWTETALSHLTGAENDLASLNFLDAMVEIEEDKLLKRMEETDIEPEIRQKKIELDKVQVDIKQAKKESRSIRNKLNKLRDTLENSSSLEDGKAELKILQKEEADLERDVRELSTKIDMNRKTADELRALKKAMSDENADVCSQLETAKKRMVVAALMLVIAQCLIIHWAFQ